MGLTRELLDKEENLPNTNPPADQTGKSTLRHSLSALLRQLIALFLDIRHLRDALARLTQAHAQVISAVLETRDANIDRRSVLDIDGELLSARRVADEIANFGGRRPADEVRMDRVVRVLLAGCVVVRLRQRGVHLVALVQRAGAGLAGVDSHRLARRVAYLRALDRFVNLLLLLLRFPTTSRQVLLAAVLGAEIHLRRLPVFQRGQLALDQALEVAEGLLRVHEQGEGLDVLAVEVSVARRQGQDEFEHAAGGREEFALCHGAGAAVARHRGDVGAFARPWRGALAGFQLAFALDAVEVLRLREGDVLRDARGRLRVGGGGVLFAIFGVAGARELGWGGEGERSAVLGVGDD